MPAASKPVQTSAPQVKELLAKTGRFVLRSEQYDKLEAVVELVQRIKERIEQGAKMDLQLSDLNAFLRREGITEEPDIKGCVSKIIQFVHSQHKRLALYAQAVVDGTKKANDADKVLHDLLKLWGMEYEEVERCFAIEVYSLSGSNKRDRDSEGTDAQVEPDAEKEGETTAHSPLVPHGQKRGHDNAVINAQIEAHNSDNESKRRCIKDRSVDRETLDGVRETALVVVPHRDRLVEDLKRIVPATMLKLEDASEGDSSTDRRALALAEVERIHQANSEGSQILLGDTIDKRRQAFRVIVRLLHPDVDLVSADDARAMQALELSLKSFMKSELSGE